MKTIQSWDGKTCMLSDEIYTVNDSGITLVPIGTKVHLISGIDNNPTPGYHWQKDYATVCPVARVKQNLHAHFIGFKKSSLSLVVPPKKVSKPNTNPNRSQYFVGLSDFKDTVYCFVNNKNTGTSIRKSDKRRGADNFWTRKEMIDIIVTPITQKNAEKIIGRKVFRNFVKSLKVA